MKDELEIAPWANSASSHCNDYSLYKDRDDLGIIEEKKQYYRRRGEVMDREVIKYYHTNDPVRHRSYEAAYKSAIKKGFISDGPGKQEKPLYY